MFIPILGIFVPYIQSMNFSMTEFFALHSFFALIVIILEVPSGYIADLFGRKQILVIASILSGIAFSLLPFSNTFIDFLIYEALVGASFALASGADFSLMYDSFKSNNISRDQQKVWVSRFQSASLYGESASAILGGLLALLSFKHVVYATAIAGWLPLIIIIYVKNIEIKRMDKSTTRANMQKVFKHIFNSNKLIRLIFTNFVIWSLSTMSAVWLIQKHLSDEKVSMFLMGMTWALFSILAAIFSSLSPKIEKKLGIKKCLTLSSLLIVAGYFSLAFFPFTISFFAASLFYISRGIMSVIYKEEFNNLVPEEFRATANSIFSLAFRFSFMIIGPCLGFTIDKYGLKYLFLFLSIIFTLAAILFLKPLFSALPEFRSHKKT